MLIVAQFIQESMYVHGRLGRKGHNPHELPLGNHYDF